MVVIYLNKKKAHYRWFYSGQVLLCNFSNKGNNCGSRKGNEYGYKQINTIHNTIYTR
jgi:hypothetical protein